jgi:glutamate--cysteine ligase catalytic subunit
MALSASTPFMKGTLLDTDTRWELLCQAVDDRNKRERAPGCLHKSRYGAASIYMSEDKRNLKKYCDVGKRLNRWARTFLFKKAKEMNISIDKKMIEHVSTLFVRDNLCVFRTWVDKEVDPGDTKLFEAIQSSNWNNVRFKPPPSMDSSIGWRVEFRTLDVQLTPSQTFLFSHSIQLLARIITSLKDELNFYIPLSLVPSKL